MHPSSSPASKMNPFPFKSCLTFHLKGVILIKLRPFPFLNGQPDTIWLPTWHHGQAWIIWHLGPKVWISSWSSSYHSSSQSFPSRLQMVHILVPRNSIIDIMDTPDGRARQSSPELPVLILSRAYIYIFPLLHHLFVHAAKPSHLPSANAWGGLWWRQDIPNSFLDQQSIL